MKKLVPIAIACSASVLIAACGDTAKNVTDGAKSAASTAATNANSTLSQAVGESGSKTNADGSVTKTCTVSGVPNINPDKVNVEVTSKGKAAAAATYVSCPSANPVVQMTARLKAEKPVQAGPFACTPIVSGNQADFTCTLTISDAATVTYKFTLNYKG